VIVLLDIVYSYCILLLDFKERKPNQFFTPFHISNADYINKYLNNY